MSYANGPRIVTSGLIACIDPASPRSYPGSGTAVTNLIGGGYSPTLLNGAAYTGSNLGAFTCDGVNDELKLTGCCNFGTGSASITFWAKGFITGGNERTTTNHGWTQWWNEANGWSFNIDAYTGAPYGEVFSCSLAGTADYAKWHYYGVSVNKTGNAFVVCFDGNIQSYSRTFSITTPTGFNNIQFGHHHNHVYVDTYTSGSWGQIAVYNRTLTAAELVQNYNAAKGRYL